MVLGFNFLTVKSANVLIARLLAIAPQSHIYLTISSSSVRSLEDHTQALDASLLQDIQACTCGFVIVHASLELANVRRTPLFGVLNTKVLTRLSFQPLHVKKVFKSEEKISQV